MRVTSVLLQIAAAGVLAGCVGCGPSERQSANNLSIWAAPGGIEERAFLRLRDRFQIEHPGTRVDVLGPVAEDKVLRGIIAGCPPDVAYMYSTYLIGPLAANHAILPLDEQFRAAGFTNEQFLAGTMEQGSFRGHLYAMPVTRDSRGFYWSRAVFRDAGLDPDRPPVTLEEAMQMSRKITRFKPNGSLARLGFQPPDDSAVMLFLLGGRLYDAKADVITLDCPENLRALKWIVGMYDAQGGYAAVNAFKSGFGRADSTQNPLAMGLVGMQVAGEWIAMYLEKYTPEADYGIGRLPYPASMPHLANMAYQDGDTMVIPDGAKNPKLAWEFMRWMQQPRQQQEYAGAMNNLPSIRALRESPALTTGSRRRVTLGYILKNIAGVSNVTRIFPTLPVTRMYLDELDRAVEAAALKHRTPEAALRDAQQRINREYGRYPR